MSDSWPVLVACPFLIGLLMYLALRVRYRISESALEITLFAVCLRRIPFSNIRRIARSRGGWCELWPNTLKPGRRLMVVELRSGWPRYIMITPRHPFAFKGELEQAMGIRRLVFDTQKLQNREASST